MFEISQLKAKKLPELQEIAKQLKVPKYRTQKKLDLVYQILDVQAANPKVVQESTIAPQEKVAPKPRRERAPRPKTETKETVSETVSETVVEPVKVKAESETAEKKENTPAAQPNKREPHKQGGGQKPQNNRRNNPPGM